jgi:hypothetical protein
MYKAKIGTPLHKPKVKPAPKATTDKPVSKRYGANVGCPYIEKKKPVQVIEEPKIVMPEPVFDIDQPKVQQQEEVIIEQPKVEGAWKAKQNKKKASSEFQGDQQSTSEETSE